MTEKPSSKNWLKDNKNKLLKAGAVIAVGSLALTGCKAGGEGTPTPPPTEQTQPETPPTVPGTTDPITPETPETPEVTVEQHEVKVTDSEIYNNLTSADKEKVDKYLDLSLEDFESLDIQERNLVSYVLMDAGSKHYIAAANKVELRPGDPSSSLGPEGVDGVSIPPIYFDAVMSMQPFKNMKPDNWDTSINNPSEIKVKMTKDGWLFSEEVPYVASGLATGVAYDMAVSAGGKYHNNLEMAQKLIAGMYLHPEDAASTMSGLETAYEAKVDVGSDRMHWPYADYASRNIRATEFSDDVSVIAVFEEPNEQGETAAEYAYSKDNVIKLKDGKKIYPSYVKDVSTQEGGTDIFNPAGQVPYE